jgi:hypothetical protein
LVTSPGGPDYSKIPGQVEGVISPQLQAVADSINRRSQMGSSAISGLTNAFSGMAGEWSGMASQAYSPDIKLARETAPYLGQSLAGAGQARQGELNSALAQSGFAPNMAPSDVPLSAEGAGGGAAIAGTGIAELDRLIANKAAAQLANAMGPSFAAGLGADNQSLLAAQLARSAADQQSQIMATIPGLTLDLTRDARSNYESDRAFTASQTAAELAKTQDQRDYDEKVREYNDTQARADAAKKAGIASATAPTLAGRQAYWSNEAAKRTAATGVLYKGTTTGIAPVVDPKTKRPVMTTAEQDRRIKTIIATGMDAAGNLTPATQKRLATEFPNLYGGAGATEFGVKTQAAYDKELNRHQEAMNRLNVAKTNASTAQGRLAATNAANAETQRHHQWVEQHPKAAKTNAHKPLGIPTGNRPRRTKGGMWTTATGAPLGPAGQRYWERRFQQGLTDGRGGLGAVNKPKTGGASLPPGVTAP